MKISSKIRTGIIEPKTSSFSTGTSKVISEQEIHAKSPSTYFGTNTNLLVQKFPVKQIFLLYISKEQCNMYTS